MRGREIEVDHPGLPFTCSTLYKELASFRIFLFAFQAQITRYSLQVLLSFTLLHSTTMYHPLFSLAAALTISFIIKTTSAGVAGLINPRYLDERQLCRGDSYYDVFNSVGMGGAGEGAQNDIEDFCYSWIPFQTVTSFYVTVTPTTSVAPLLHGRIEMTDSF